MRYCTIIARRYKTLKRPVISCKKTVWFQSNDKRSYTGHTHFWHEMKKKRHMLQTRNTLPVFTTQKQRAPIVTAEFKNRPIVVRKNLHFIFYQENYMSTALRDTFRGSKGLQQSASVLYNLFKFQVAKFDLGVWGSIYLSVLATADLYLSPQCCDCHRLSKFLTATVSIYPSLPSWNIEALWLPFQYV